MTPSHPAVRILRALALVVAAAALVVTLVLVVGERQWAARNVPKADPEDAFVNGSIGTELAPVVAFEVLPDLFPEEFRPLEAYFAAFRKPPPAAGDWVEQYGFIRRAGDLPVGFVKSYHRPGSGAGSPVEFVGLSCAACHAAEIQTDPDKPGKVLPGVGNPTMNLLAFSEAIRKVLVKRVTPDDPASDYVLSVAAVAAARKAKKLDEMTTAQSLFTALWLAAARGETTAYQKVVDAPYDPPQLFDPRYMMAGPARTQPFRSLVRIHLERPGWSANDHSMDQGFSKIPVVFHQDHKYHGPWAQFDGSVRDLIARSSLAASTAGANVNNLAQPAIAAHIKAAAEFTRNPPVPRWDDVLPAFARTAAQKELAGVGAGVYRRECYHCHGGPRGANEWMWGGGALDQTCGACHAPRDAAGAWGPATTAEHPDLFGHVTPIARLRTDPERIQFRHKRDIPRVVADKFRRPADGEPPFAADFRKDHPLATFTAADLRAPDGYYNGPISGAFLRGPYLHNASVLTLAELIGLEPRRARFYRGRNAYDPERVGFHSPPVPAGVDHKNPVPHDKHYYFLFDTAVRGNSNKGHHYPPWGAWAADDKLTDEQRRRPREERTPTPAQVAELKALLEYLKGI
jgi:cytochrome c5